MDTNEALLIRLDEKVKQLADDMKEESRDRVARASATDTKIDNIQIQVLQHSEELRNIRREDELVHAARLKQWENTEWLMAQHSEGTLRDRARRDEQHDRMWFWYRIMAVALVTLGALQPILIWFTGWWFNRG